MPRPRFSRPHPGKSIKVSARCGHKNIVKRECKFMTDRQQYMPRLSYNSLSPASRCGLFVCKTQPSCRIAAMI